MACKRLFVCSRAKTLNGTIQILAVARGSWVFYISNNSIYGKGPTDLLIFTFSLADTVTLISSKELDVYRTDRAVASVLV